MKDKNIINKNISEIIKKLVFELDDNSPYFVEFSDDMSAKVTELDVIRDKKTGKIICYKEKGH